MKLKEYATKIKNRLMGQNAKPQKEEKDDLSEKIAERTQELIAEDRQEAVRAAVVEEPEPEEEAEQPKAERNISADVMKLAAVTRGLKIDPEWTKEEMIKAVSEYSGLPEEEIEVLLESTVKWAQETGRKMVKSITETLERLKPAFEQVGKAIAEAFRKTKWTGLQLRKELISNNRRKMKGMPMIRAKAIEKARRNERRKPKSRKKVCNVQNSDETQQDMTEAIRIAVRKAFAEVKIEEKRAEKKKTLYNTRRLMESYIDLKKYINNAITEEEEVTEAAYSVLKGENAKLKSVKEAKMVTAMMIINIDRALTELETESRKEGTLYKYEAFRMHYIDGLTFEEIADQLDCGKNSPSNWCKAILKKMSVKLFGINGI